MANTNTLPVFPTSSGRYWIVAETFAVTASTLAVTAIVKGGGGALAVKLKLTGWPSGEVNVPVPTVPDHVPVYGRVTSRLVPGLMLQVPSGFNWSLKSPLLMMTCPWIGPGCERSIPVMSIVPASTKLLVHPESRMVRL